MEPAIPIVIPFMASLFENIKECKSNNDKVKP
jgi:hypothetical protein